jgi:hypothetical protein
LLRMDEALAAKNRFFRAKSKKSRF